MAQFLYLFFAVLTVVLLLKLSAAVRNYIKGRHCHNLGIRYAEAQDYTEAARWFHKGAEQGFAESQYRLAMMYAKGEGVRKDYYVKAVYWYLTAARQGYSGAIDALKGVPTSGMMIAEHEFARQTAEQASFEP